MQVDENEAIHMQIRKREVWLTFQFPHTGTTKKKSVNPFLTVMNIINSLLAQECVREVMNAPASEPFCLFYPPSDCIVDPVVRTHGYYLDSEKPLTAFLNKFGENGMLLLQKRQLPLRVVIPPNTQPTLLNVDPFWNVEQTLDYILSSCQALSHLPRDPQRYCLCCKVEDDERRISRVVCLDEDVLVAMVHEVVEIREKHLEETRTDLVFVRVDLPKSFEGFETNLLSFNTKTTRHSLLSRQLKEEFFVKRTFQLPSACTVQHLLEVVSSKEKHNFDPALYGLCISSSLEHPNGIWMEYDSSLVVYKGLYERQGMLDVVLLKRQWEVDVKLCHQHTLGFAVTVRLRLDPFATVQQVISSIIRKSPLINSADFQQQNLSPLHSCV